MKMGINGMRMSQVGRIYYHPVNKVVCLLYPSYKPGLRTQVQTHNGKPYEGSWTAEPVELNKVI